MKFKDLPLGTQFRYIGDDTTWVVLDRSGFGLIAKWEGVNGPTFGQAICSAAVSEAECESLEVDIADARDSLQRELDEAKKEVQELRCRCLDVRDALGRYNRTKLQSDQEELDRLAEGLQKKHWFDQWQIANQRWQHGRDVLNNELAAQNAVLRDAIKHRQEFDGPTLSLSYALQLTPPAALDKLRRELRREGMVEAAKVLTEIANSNPQIAPTYTGVITAILAASEKETP